MESLDSIFHFHFKIQSHQVVFSQSFCHVFVSWKEQLFQKHVKTVKLLKTTISSEDCQKRRIGLFVVQHTNTP